MKSIVIRQPNELVIEERPTLEDAYLYLLSMKGGDQYATEERTGNNVEKSNVLAGCPLHRCLSLYTIRLGFYFAKTS